MTDWLWILVTGPRAWPDPYAVRSRIAEVVAEYPDRRPVVVHGQCDPRAPALTPPHKFIPWARAVTLHPGEQGALLGADWHAHLACMASGGAWTERGVPADWVQHPRSAGHVRNGEMVRRIAVREGPKICLPFVAPCEDLSCTRADPHGTHGTAGCVKVAQKHGLQIRWPAP